MNCQFRRESTRSILFDCFGEFCRPSTKIDPLTVAHEMVSGLCIEGQLTANLPVGLGFPDAQQSSNPVDPSFKPRVCRGGRKHLHVNGTTFVSNVVDSQNAII